MTADRYDGLPTERPNPDHPRLDTMTPLQLVSAIHRADQQALRAVGGARRQLARAVELVHGGLSAGGRLIYVGAGTSGRLGLLDAAECPPTFSVPPSLVLGVLAGGKRALCRAVEGAEDSAADGAAAMVKAGVGRPDVVCGITASGVTPFVRGALNRARRRRCTTLLLTCAPAALADPRGQLDLLLTLDVGPEIVAGSTRMKAGLATKATLHTLTTAAMVRLGKVHDNLMVDVRPTNRKLRRRARGIVAQLTGLPPRRAGELLRRAGGNPKVAVVMGARRVDRATAKALLEQSQGFLRPVIEGDR